MLVGVVAISRLNGRIDRVPKDITANLAFTPAERDPEMVYKCVVPQCVHPRCPCPKEGTAEMSVANASNASGNASNSTNGTENATTGAPARRL